MLHKASANKARSLYYGFFSKLFVFTARQERYKDIEKALNIMIEHSLDDASHEALIAFQSFWKTEGEQALIQEYDDIFHNPAYPCVRNTTSYYDEEVESGHQRLIVKNFLAQTTLRRDEQNFKENEDSFGFIFTFMHELVEGIMQEQKEYEHLQTSLFTEVINPFVDAFIERVYSHPKAKAYQSIAIVLNTFMAFERMYFEVAKPPLKEDTPKRNESPKKGKKKSPK